MRIENQVIAAFLVLLVGCASTATQEWQAVPPSEGTLMLNGPGLERVATDRERAKSVHQTLERARWQGRGGLREAVLMLIEAGSETVFCESSASPLDETIEQNFSDAALGESGNSVNAIAKLEYQRFTISGTTRCVYMRQFFGGCMDQYELVTGCDGEPLGNTMLEGFYCGAVGEKLPDGTLEQFFHGIGVKGFAEPLAGPVSKGLVAKALISSNRNIL